MSVPHQMREFNRGTANQTCVKCGRATSALHHTGECCKCFDLEEEAKRVIDRRPVKTEEQKQAMRDRYQRIKKRRGLKKEGKK